LRQRTEREETGVTETVAARPGAVLAEMDTEALRRRHAALFEALRRNDREWIFDDDARARRRLNAKKEEVWARIADVGGEILARGEKVFSGGYARHDAEFRAAGLASQSERHRRAREERARRKKKGR
jgi:hypothetical protein